LTEHAITTLTLREGAALDSGVIDTDMCWLTEILQGWQGWWTSGQLLQDINLFVWQSSNRLVLVDRRLWGFVQMPIHDTCLWIMSIPSYNYTLGNYDCTTSAGYICEIELLSYN